MDLGAARLKWVLLAASCSILLDRRTQPAAADTWQSAGFAPA